MQVKRGYLMRPSLQRARQLSRLMQRALLSIGLVLIGVSIFLAARTLMDPAWIASEFRTQNGVMASGTMTMGQTVGLLTLSMLQIGSLLAAFYALWRAFGTIAAGEGIVIDTALWIRRAGFAFAATSLIMVLSIPLGTAIGSWGQAPGQRFVSIAFNAQQLLTFLLAAVLIIIGHVLALAADISDDNRQIV
jgi:hypothetical protein